MSTRAESTRRSFALVHVVLDTGEHLPTLVERDSGLPLRLALRWAVRTRRLTRASSTLAADLRAVRRLYQWGETKGIDLDGYLLAGHSLDAAQLTSLAHELSRRAEPAIAGNITPSGRPTDAVGSLGSGTFDRHLDVVTDFLDWCLDPMNRGGWSRRGGSRSPRHLTRRLKALAPERRWLRETLHAYRVGATPSRRHEPLSAPEERRLWAAVDPARIRGAPQRPLVFPSSVFSPSTALRNWLMLRLAHDAGLRRGELLKLRIDDATRDPDGEMVLTVRRRPDDPADERRYEPGVKTGERRFALGIELVHGMRAYLTAPLSLGRHSGRTPYLFVTPLGAPLSLAAADLVMAELRRHTGITPLSWHRLRHSWAEELADELLADCGEEHQWMEKLRYLGGWSPSSDTPLHYIQLATAKHAQDFLRRRNARLYATPTREREP